MGNGCGILKCYRRVLELSKYNSATLQEHAGKEKQKVEGKQGGGGHAIAPGEESWGKQKRKYNATKENSNKFTSKSANMYITYDYKRRRPLSDVPKNIF